MRNVWGVKVYAINIALFYSLETLGGVNRNREQNALGQILFGNRCSQKKTKATDNKVCDFGVNNK